MPTPAPQPRPKPCRHKCYCLPDQHMPVASTCHTQHVPTPGSVPASHVRRAPLPMYGNVRSATLFLALRRYPQARHAVQDRTARELETRAQHVCGGWGRLGATDRCGCQEFVPPAETLVLLLCPLRSTPLMRCRSDRERPVVPGLAAAASRRSGSSSAAAAAAALLSRKHQNGRPSHHEAIRSLP